MVIDELPSKVGQRVQDVFVGTRGWVQELGERNGTKVAVVAWDEPEPSVGEDDSVFPVDALRVVKRIAIDLDRYRDPALHPEVEESRTEGDLTIYRLKDGTVIKGTDLMRTWMLGYHERA
ncbi:hypothetical protein SEA_KEANU_76 [Streptomyces phage Keanu]|nr:hypothetical protein SEA_KEANU_76 [Streptomyces phage Keanu]